MEEEEKQYRLFLAVVAILTFLFSLYIGLTIYNEKPFKCHKTDTCNSIFR